MIMMQVFLMATLRTVHTRNGTVNYLFEKPENSPLHIVQEIAPTQNIFTYFLLSKTLVQNLDFELTLTNDKASVIALSYNKEIGVTYEFSRLVVNCDACKKLTFAPILRAPQLGLFYCVFNISKADYIITPQFTTVVHSVFMVDQFSIKKTRFLTLENNSIRAQGYNSYRDFMHTQDHKDEHCLSCQSNDKTVLSQCSCDQSGFMKGSACFHTIVPTELLTDTESNTQYYLTCDQLSKTNVKINQKLSINTSATTIQLLKSADCVITNVTVEGSIKVNGPDNMENHIYGISKLLSSSILHVNISLNITQQNSGLSGSSLMFQELKENSTVMDIRLSGSIISQSTSSNDCFSLVSNEMKESANIMMIGIFGCTIQVQSNNVGFIVAKLSANEGGISFIYIAPLVPKEQQFIDIGSLSQVSLKYNDFACFGYASKTYFDSLKVETYFDQFDQIELLPQSQILVDGNGGSNIGGLIGMATGQNKFIIRRIGVMISIIDSGTSLIVSGIGSLTGFSTQSLSIQLCYVNSDINAQAIGVGSIGLMQTSAQSTLLLSFAATGNIYGKDKVGIIGSLNQMSGSANLQAIVTIFLNASSNSGFIGATSNTNFFIDCTGEVNIINGQEYHFFGQVGEEVYINSSPLSDTINIIGSTVNQCSAEYQKNLQEINANDILIDESVASLRKRYYSTPCIRNAIISVDINKIIDEDSLVQVFQNDNCFPQNLNIKGILQISSSTSNSSISIAGYLESPTSSLIYINQSLQIDTTQGQNAKFNISLLSHSMPSFQSTSFIRISGVIKSVALQDSDSISAFLFCSSETYISNELDNIGIFGATMQISQFSQAGAIGIHSGQTSFKIKNVVITQGSNDSLLPRQIIVSRYYYAEDKCASYIQYDDARTGALNVEQFYTLQTDYATSTLISSFGKNSQNIGLFIGYIKKSPTGDYLELDTVAIFGSVFTRTETSQSSNIGALFGQAHRDLVISNTRVNSMLTGSTNSGIIGFCQDIDVNITAAFKYYIQGDDHLGCFGQLINVTGDLLLYIDAAIVYDKNYVGGLAGTITNSPKLNCNNLIINTVLTGNGKPAEAIVGYQDSDKNWYDGSQVNQC